MDWTLRTTSTYAALQVTINDLGNNGVGGPLQDVEQLYVRRMVDDPLLEPFQGVAGIQRQGVFTSPAVVANAKGDLQSQPVQTNRAQAEREQINSPV